MKSRLAKYNASYILTNSKHFNVVKRLRISLKKTFENTFKLIVNTSMSTDKSEGIEVHCDRHTYKTSRCRTDKSVGA